jgi:hypothetical protein
MMTCLYENIDKSKVQQLINCQEIGSECCKQLKNYLKKYDHQKKAFRVEYEPQGLMIGRKYAKQSLSLQNFKKDIRETLVYNTHTDLDIKNAHFDILNQYCKKNNIQCELIDDYVNNRDCRTQEIIELYKTTRGIAKKLFITMLYGGDINNYCCDCGFDVSIEFPNWVVPLQKELIRVTDFVCSINEDIFDGVKKLRKKEYINKKASCLSYVLQIIEDDLITKASTKLKQKNICVDTLCFDGLLVNNTKINSDILEELQSYCFEKTGYKVVWAIKPMEKHYEYVEQKYDFSDFNFKHLEEYNQIYCDELSGNTPPEIYAKRKAYIEHFICKVQQPEPLFIFQNGIHKRPCILQPRQLQTLIKPINSGFETAVGLIPFYEKWIVDTKHRLYRSMDFMPYNNNNPISDPNIFNVFEGFNDDIYSDPIDKEVITKKITPYIDLVRELCGGNDKDAEYFHKFIAQIFQDPSNKVPICIILKGKQGVGKNIILDAIGNMLNKSHYITSSKPKDFFGEHAEGYYRKLLVNLNEAEGKDTFDFEGKIKSFISEDTITINPKNVRPTEISNHARTIITTNKQNPIPIDVKSKDRRYCVFQSTDAYLTKSRKFWGELFKHLQKPEVMASIYQYYMSFNLSNFDWIKKRPLTQAYKDMCSLFSPIEALFFEEFYYKEQWKDVVVEDDVFDGLDMLEKDDMIKISFSSIFELYEKFCKKNRFLKDETKATNIRTFINRLDGLELPFKKIKTRGFNSLLFIPQNIYDFIEKKKWINGWIEQDNHIKQFNESDEDDEDEDDEELLEYFN